MIILCSDDLLRSEVEALVNTVSCVGVMAAASHRRGLCIAQHHRRRQLPELIGGGVRAALGAPTPAPEPVREAPIPAVAIRKSITPDHLIGFEDGKRYKLLKRQLSVGFGLTPEAYRAK